MWLRLSLRCITQRQELILLLLLQMLFCWLSAVTAIAMGLVLKDAGSDRRGNIVMRDRNMFPVRQPEFSSRLASRELLTTTEHRPLAECGSRRRPSRWRRAARSPASSADSSGHERDRSYNGIPAEHISSAGGCVGTDRPRAAGQRGRGAHCTRAFVVPSVWPLFRETQEGGRYPFSAHTCGTSRWRGTSGSSEISSKKASRLPLFSLEFIDPAASRAVSGGTGKYRRPHQGEGFDQDARGRCVDCFVLGANAVSGFGAGDLVAEEQGQRPLLITIGPQCSGKTTLLRHLGQSGAAVTDVAIDDHPSVYFDIPLNLLLDGCESGSHEDETVGGLPLSSRLRDPGCVEIRLVASRLLGITPAEEFANGIQRCGGSKASPSALDALCGAVETAVSDNLVVSTPSVDVFIRESLFPEAISASLRRLAAAADKEWKIVAWGNTNTQARDFRGALEQAKSTGRPVRFLRWGHELPRVSLDELSRRNVYRFATTGRYVETAAIETALARVERLYASTNGGDSAELAFAAGFRMDASGRVSSLSSYSSSAAGDRGGAPPPRPGVSSSEAGSTGHVERRKRRTRRPSDTSPGRRGNPLEPGDVDLGGQAGGRDGGLKRGMPPAGSEEMTPRQSSDSTGPYPASRGGGGLRSSVNFLGTPYYGGGIITSPTTSLSSRSSFLARPVPIGRRAGIEVEGRCGVVLGLAQAWCPRGGRRLAVGGSGRRRAVESPTVLFASEWKRMREWRRSGYSDDDIDPTMSSCYFSKPANSTGVLKRFDAGSRNADLEEMELVRTISSIRQRN